MSAFTPENSPIYQHEDIQEILHIAIARQTDPGEFSHEELVDIAAELGISEDCLQSAEQEWHEQQFLHQKYRTFNLYRQQLLQHKAGKYAIINGFLIVIDFLGGHTVSWSLYPLLFSGLWVSLDAWKVFLLKGEAYEQAFLRWERKRQFKRSIGVFWQNLRQVVQE